MVMPEVSPNRTAEDNAREHAEFEAGFEQRKPWPKMARMQQWINTSTDDCRIMMDNLVGTARHRPEMIPADIRDLDAAIQECDRRTGHRTRIKHLQSARRKLVRYSDDYQAQQKALRSGRDQFGGGRS
jgi:hypothetical protein